MPLGGDVGRSRIREQQRERHLRKAGVDAAEFLERRANAYQAYYEAMPLRYRSVPHGPHMKLYRTLEYGRLATFQVLDTRQYRTDQPNGDVRRNGTTTP